MKLKPYFRRMVALPSEHGAWVFLLSPLLIGLFAARHFSLASMFLIIAALAAFLLRQPVSILVKAYSGRRPRSDLPAARFWMVVYGLIGLAALIELILLGHSYLIWLALPGIPVFLWHLILVSRRAERRQAGVEIIGSGVLALSAPAAYWVGVGQPDPTGWWLFILCWLQSAASIVYAYLRLEQRDLKTVPDRPTRIGMARRALLYTTFNLVAVLILSIRAILPQYLFLPYALQWVETLWGTMNPAVGVKPTRIGMRQLAVSSLFTILFIITWLV
jgi:hypothetical protein